MQICVNARKGHHGPEKLESLMTVSCHVGARNEPKSSQRIAHAFTQIPKQYVF